MSDKSDDKRPDAGDVEDYGAEQAPDDSAPDIVKRGAEKDKHDAEVQRLRDSA